MAVSRFRKLLPLAVRRRIANRIWRRAHAARDRHEWTKASEGYRNGLAWNDQRAGMWVQYGHALKESGRVRQAIVAYQTALKLEPENAEFHYQLGVARRVVGDFEGALWSLRRARDLDPNHPAVPAAMDAVIPFVRRRSTIRPASDYEFPYEHPDLT